MTDIQNMVIQIWYLVNICFLKIKEACHFKRKKEGRKEGTKEGRKGGREGSVSYQT